MDESIPDDRHGRLHPDWYDGNADFGDARYAFALRVGSRLADVSSDEWPRVEAVLMAMWVILHEGMSWDEARPAVYHTWVKAKSARGR